MNSIHWLFKLFVYLFQLILFLYIMFIYASKCIQKMTLAFGNLFFRNQELNFDDGSKN